MKHKFYLIIDKNVSELKATNMFMNWVKDVSEFLLPNNTGTTPEEFFELMNVAKKISNNVTSVESTKHYIYQTKQ